MSYIPSQDGLLSLDEKLSRGIVSMAKKKPTIFVVDNEIEICNLLKDFFDFMGFDSQFETDGQKVLRDLERYEYDVLFVDLRLDAVSGIEILKKSRALKPLSEVIVVTGFGTDDTILQTFQYGASAYIQKPISFTEIKVHTEAALARRRLNINNEKLKRIIGKHNATMVKHFEDILHIDKLSEFFNLTIDIETLVDSILAGVATLIPHQYYTFFIYEEYTKEMVILSRRGISHEIITTIQGETKKEFERLSNSMIEDIYKVRLSVPADIKEYNGEEKIAGADRHGFVNILVPILIENKIHSIIGVSGDGIRNAEYVEDILRIIARRISGVLKNATLHRNTKLLALTDGLTGLLNHRAFYDRLRSEYERFRRYGTYLSLIVADFDNLKFINDTFGHPTGDEVIKMIGGILQETSREADVLARYGGDEFVLLLPETNSQNAVNMAERIRSKIEKNKLNIGGKKFNCTISVGVATAPDKKITSYEDLLERADQALYESKKYGKNRVTQISDS